MKSLMCWGIAVCVMLSICFAGDGAQFKEGKWTITTVIKIDGNAKQDAEMAAAMKELENLPPAAKEMMKKMQGQGGPQMSMGTAGGGLKTTITQCITAKEPVPSMSPNKTDCKQTYTIQGNTVTFHTVCKEQTGQVEADGKMTFAGDTMQGQIKARQTGKGGQVTNTTMDMTGKYLGPCQ
jgi:hypothetical protein